MTPGLFFESSRPKEKWKVSIWAIVVNASTLFFCSISQLYLRKEADWQQQQQRRDVIIFHLRARTPPQKKSARPKIEKSTKANDPREKKSQTRPVTGASKSTINGQARQQRTGLHKWSLASFTPAGPRDPGGGGVVVVSYVLNFQNEREGEKVINSSLALTLSTVEAIGAKIVKHWSKLLMYVYSKNHQT